MIRVLIVDDHAFLRAGVAAVLRTADGIEVVGECADGAHVPAVAPVVQPDVVLMDVRMPGISGTVATRCLLITQPMIRVVMLSGSMNAQVVDEAALAGAVGFLLKGDHPNELIEAVRTVADGGTVWPGQRTLATS